VVGLTSLQVLNTMFCWDLMWGECKPSGVARGKLLVQANPTRGASLEDICRSVVLTNLHIRGLELPHNISALTKLNILQLNLVEAKTLPAEMVYWFKQLKVLQFWTCGSLEYLPSSFTCRDAFPALVKLELCACGLVEFPEVHEGALPQLQILDLSYCDYLETLPLSLEILPSLRELIVVDCERVANSFRKYCEKSAIWCMLDIEYGGI
jgi:hypothetical protein